MIRNCINIFIFSVLLLYSCGRSSENTSKEVNHKETKIQYTCSMHPEIIRDKPGNCPICGMALVKMENGGAAIDDDTLAFILKPVNQQVLLKIRVVHPETKSIVPEFQYQGFISFIPQDAGSVVARLTGRIEKIYVKYNYQAVVKGQKLFEIYSPELLTEQNNLLFLLRDDASNKDMIEAVRNKLKLLGLSDTDLASVERSGKSLNAVPVYSNYSGFITNVDVLNGAEASGMGPTNNSPSTVLSVKEGSYIQKGQTVLKVINQNRLWAILSIPVADLSFINAGNKVRIKPESAPENDFRGEINYIEPVLDAKKKKANARVIFDNSKYNLPIGSQLSAILFGDSVAGTWLPKDAVINLGRQKAVLLKTGIGFKVKLIIAGDDMAGMTRVISGVTGKDEVAENAQYIMDSESFIKEF